MEPTKDGTKIPSSVKMNSSMLIQFVLLLSVFADLGVFAFRNLHIFATKTPVHKSDHRTRSMIDQFTLSLARGEDYISGNAGDNDQSRREGESPARYNGSKKEYGKTESDAELFLLEYSIDSFLRGEYDRTFSEDAASPLPGLSPSDTVDAALRSLRDLDKPEPSHGAAVFLRFCVELGRGERWGTTIQGSDRRMSSSSSSSWKELLRGALTPTMLARRLRASEEFSDLLDWTQLEITERASDTAEKNGGDATILQNGNVACVDAALSFDEDSSESTLPPEVYRFQLAKMLGGVWLIDSVEQRSSGFFRQPAVSRSKALSPRSKRKARRAEGGRTPRRPQQQQRGKPRRRPEGKGKSGDEDGDENQTNKRATK
jgi:hypothetical protein